MSLNSVNIPIGHKEQERVQYVLKHYDINPEKVEKLRYAYKIICGDKSYCLKKIRYDDRKSMKELKLLSYLKSTGFDNVVNNISAKDGIEYIKNGKTKYFLTEWVDGRECDVNDFSEAKKSVVLLAQFHLKSKGFYDKHTGMDSNIKNWPAKMEYEKKQLDFFKHIIEGKRIKSTFDNKYYHVLDMFKNRMEISTKLLKQLDYNNLSQIAKLEKSICCLNFHYRNITVGNSGEIYLTSLDRIIYDLNVYDLASYLGIVLNKKVYNWSFNAAKELIETYCEVKPLSKEELGILLAFMIFPHRFWKLGRKRYEKKKKWDEDKYLKKIDKLIRYFDNQTEFIDSFIKYFSIPAEI
jgi:CotS family spore coat protein